MFGDQRVVFDVDLNSVRDGNRVTALLRHVTTYPGAMPRVEMGDWVQVEDEDGNLWAALVDSVEGQRVRLKIDWNLWTAASHDLPARTVRVPVGSPVVTGSGIRT